MFELQQYLQHPATSAQNADSAPRTIPTIFRMAVVDSKQERGKIRQSDSYCMYFAPLDPVYASPNKFWNEQKLARFRLSFTRDPRKRARFCPDQKCIWTHVNNTAICKSTFTVPCKRVTQVKNSSVKNFAPDPHTVDSYFEKGCRKKCARVMVSRQATIPKGNMGYDQ